MNDIGLQILYICSSIGPGCGWPYVRMASTGPPPSARPYIGSFIKKMQAKIHSVSINSNQYTRSLREESSRLLYRKI